MYFVGIDISKYKHDCFITTESGDVICNSFTIKNNHDGFEELLTVLNSLDHQEEISYSCHLYEKNDMIKMY